MRRVNKSVAIFSISNNQDQKYHFAALKTEKCLESFKNIKFAKTN